MNKKKLVLADLSVSSFKTIEITRDVRGGGTRGCGSFPCEEDATASYDPNQHGCVSYPPCYG